MIDLGPPGRRILIVDDDRSICDLIDMRLGVYGVKTAIAHDGRIALAMVKTFQPHAMILDINMPAIDGFGVMENLGLAKMAALPTLVLTARHQTDDVRKAVLLGARDYLAKPFEDQMLLARVARMLRKPPN